VEAISAKGWLFRPRWPAARSSRCGSLKHAHRLGGDGPATLADGHLLHARPQGQGAYLHSDELFPLASIGGLRRQPNFLRFGDHSRRAGAAGIGPCLRIARSGPGAGALSDAELVALSLGGSGRGESALALARRLLAEAGSLHRLLAWNEADFRQRTGIGRARAWRIIAAFEAARRVFTRPVEELPILKQAEQVAQYLTPFTAGLEVEVFWTLCLNRKSRLLRKVEVTIGTATAALAIPAKSSGPLFGRCMFGSGGAFSPIRDPAQAARTWHSPGFCGTRQRPSKSGFKTTS